MKIKVQIIPNASRNEITGRNDNGVYKVKVQAPPVNNSANKKLIKFISGTVGVSKSKVRIVSGIKSRNKTLEIDCDEKKIVKLMER